MHMQKIVNRQKRTPNRQTVDQKPCSRKNQTNTTQQNNWKKGSSSPREASVSRFSTCIENSQYFWETIATEFLRKYRDSKAVALKEYYDYSPISTYTESCQDFLETIVTVKLLIYRNQ